MESLATALLFTITVGSALIVAFSKNLIYSAFALIGTFAGVAGTFVLLSSEFLGLAQIVVYAGGILVLTIFAVMLTARIESKNSNPVIHKKIVVPVVLALIGFLISIVQTDLWAQKSNPSFESTTSQIGNALLTDYLLPFELVSVVLLVAMIGAAIITRRHVKED